MKRSFFWLLGAGLICSVANAALMLARDGKAGAIITVDSASPEPEKRAAQELSRVLGEITGAVFSVQEGAGTSAIRGPVMIVGSGRMAREFFPEIHLDQLGADEVILKRNGDKLLLAGGPPRGTLYAVSRFLELQGVRWWTPWARDIPRKKTLAVGKLDAREKPAFEYREPYWFPAFNGEWSWHNRMNGQASNVPAELGGSIHYKGFVHTFYPLVPPDRHFADHPEWFSLVKGQRTSRRAQLCLTNPHLRQFMVQRVKEWLRESPEAGIVSVSQNDWYGACECAQCQEMDDAEGSHAGTMLDFVNFIAENIEKDFPGVAVDTLAYQYTRKPPKSIKPRANVIVRLCSIECNFREPLEHASNAAFADDIRGWSKICQRLYIWDYTTDFAHYIQPHPNWFVLGDNLRFFQSHGVRGVFEQGAYQSHGSEMAEMRAWVLAQLLWNPRQNDRELIDEFLNGYFGRAAAKPIRRYLERMHQASQGFKLTCFSKTEVPFLTFPHLAEAERLWQSAEKAAARNPEFLRRVQLAHLPVRYVWLQRWENLRQECAAAHGVWPLPSSRKQVADEWAAVAAGVAGKPWTQVTRVNEGGLTPEAFLARFVNDASK